MPKMYSAYELAEMRERWAKEDEAHKELLAAIEERKRQELELLDARMVKLKNRGSVLVHLPERDFLLVEDPKTGRRLYVNETARRFYEQTDPRKED